MKISHGRKKARERGAADAEKPKGSDRRRVRVSVVD